MPKKSATVKPSSASINKTTIFILALIMVVNALSYGVIIPLLYPFAARFGIGPVGLGLLFASFSLFQLIATPIMGRLSDRHGRKPLLFISLLGTAVSLALFASAQNVAMLFIARILDGITGGNISIAQAVIADTTAGSQRAKGMGMLGAAFGFGFLFGPAVGGLLSPLGLSAPFWFAAGLAAVGSVFLALFLPETLSKATMHKAVHHEPMFDVKKFMTVMKMPLIGGLLWLTLASGVAHFALVIGFQSFSVDYLHLSAREVGLIFTGFGLVNVLMQAAGIALILKIIPSKIAALNLLLVGSTFFCFLFAMATNMWDFTAISMLYGMSFSPQFIMIVGLISEGSRQEDQGAILGINQSVQSLAQIIGPVLASVVAGLAGVKAVFPMAGVLFLLAILTARTLKLSRVKADI